MIEKGKLFSRKMDTLLRMNGGDIAFPDLTFLQLLFGYRQFAELSTNPLRIAGVIVEDVPCHDRYSLSEKAVGCFSYCLIGVPRPLCRYSIKGDIKVAIQKWRSKCKFYSRSIHSGTKEQSSPKIAAPTFTRQPCRVAASP